MIQDMPGFQLLRMSYEHGMAPIPAWGILLDWPEPGIHLCACGGEQCGDGPDAGKHPRIKWGSFTRPAWGQVEEWIYKFQRIDQPLNWAYHFGASGLAGLDIDPRNGGFESWAKLITEYGDVPRTPKDSIEGRGWHYWFQAPTAGVLPETTHVHLLSGVELKHGEGYFFGPPSFHRCGKPYRWDLGLAPWETPFAPLPQWVIDLAWKHEEEKCRKNKPTDPIRQAELRSYQLPNGSADRERIYERARKLLATIPPGVEGQNGSKPTYRAACALILGFGLNVNESLPLLAEYSNRCVPPWSEKELRHKLAGADKEPGPRGYLLHAPWSAELAGLENVEFESVWPCPRGGDGAATRSFAPDDLEDLARVAEVITAEKERLDEQERQVSLSIQQTREHSSPCPNSIGIFIGNERSSQLIFRRCERWNCFACRQVHHMEWRENIKLRLSFAGGLFAFSCTRDQWQSCISRRCSRMEAEHFLAWDGSENQFYVITDKPISGSTPVGLPGAVEKLTRLVEDPQWHGKHIHASRGWKIPRVKLPKSDKTRLGLINLPLSDERIEAIAEANRVRVEEKNVPRAFRPWVFRMLGFHHPPGWTLDDVHQFYFQLSVGEVLEPEAPVWRRNQSAFDVAFAEDG